VKWVDKRLLVSMRISGIEWWHREGETEHISSFRMPSRTSSSSCDSMITVFEAIRYIAIDSISSFNVTRRRHLISTPKAGSRAKKAQSAPPSQSRVVSFVKFAEDDFADYSELLRELFLCSALVKQGCKGLNRPGNLPAPGYWSNLALFQARLITDSGIVWFMCSSVVGIGYRRELYHERFR
jgi:hypothetical protein